VVGHDIGGMVAYAFARRYPETSRGVMMLDAPLPGRGPWDAIKANRITWHINFQQTPGLPEQLLPGREAIYLRHFLDSDTFSDADVARYTRAYAAPEHLRAALEIYRAFPANEKFNAAQQSTISVPLVLAPGKTRLSRSSCQASPMRCGRMGAQMLRSKSSITALLLFFEQIALGTNKLFPLRGGRIDPMVRLKQVSLLFLLAFAICQCVPVRHPPLQQSADGGATRRLNLNNPNIEAVLNRSCGDCHSSHASLPWYGRIAPVSWLVASHIEKGIHKWDLSVWESRKPLRGELEDICDAVTDRSMPLRSYTWIHPKAKLADRDIATLCGLAESSSSTDKSTR